MVNCSNLKEIFFLKQIRTTVNVAEKYKTTFLPYSVHVPMKNVGFINRCSIYSCYLYYSKWRSKKKVIALG